MQTTKDFESGPIPPHYAKVIDVGPEGETSSGAEVMPTHVAIHRLGISPEEMRQANPLSDARAIIIHHPWGITIITFNDHGATSETIRPE